MSRRFYAFNGDADGLCALQQLRLAEPGPATLITGVKRDIRLLRHIDASADDIITVLDISLDRNRSEVVRLLASGATVRYFDHHHAGEIPRHARFEPYIDDARDVCTSILVDRYLNGRHRDWAIVAAFGDELVATATDMAQRFGFDDADVATLRKLGTLLNYNAYGSDVSDLHFDPGVVASQMLHFQEPLSFAAGSHLPSRLEAAFEEDMRKAREIRPVQETPGASIIVLPAEKWARRAIGALANELMSTKPGCAIAMLAPDMEGGFAVSVRAPIGCVMGADDFCRMFETGGGRKQAAGINHLPQEDIERFRAAFIREFSR